MSLVNSAIFYSDRSLLLSALVACLGFFVYLVLFSDFVYIQYDAYYYGAIADTILKSGAILDGSSEPPLPVKTPQNAIVAVHVLLALAGVESLADRMVAIALLNSLSLVASAYVLFRIALVLGITRPAAFLASLSVSLSFYYHMVLLQAINDAFFLLLSLLAIYLIARQEYSRRHLTALAMVAAAIPFFRIAGVLIFLSAFATFLLLQQYRRSMLFLALAALGVVTPLVVSWLLGVDYSGFGARKDEIVGMYGLGYFADHLWRTASISIPEALFRMTYFTTGMAIRPAVLGLVISAAVAGFVILALVKSWRHRDAAVLFLCVLVAAVLAFFQVHSAQPTRYLMVISPLLPLFLLLALRGAQQLAAARGIFVVCILVSVAGLAIGTKPEEAGLKRQFAENIPAFVADRDYTLVSYFPRMTYFLLGKPARQLEHVDPDSAPRNILVVGPADYMNHIIKKIPQSFGVAATGAELLPVSYLDYAKNPNSSAYFQYTQVSIGSVWLTLGAGAAE